MRIRRRPWARPELEACEYFLHQPTANKGKWNKVFDAKRPIYLELGCGKGQFIAQMASSHPEINFIAMDLKSEMLRICKKKNRTGIWR